MSLRTVNGAALHYSLFIKAAHRRGPRTGPTSIRNTIIALALAAAALAAGTSASQAGYGYGYHSYYQPSYTYYQPSYTYYQPSYTYYQPTYYCHTVTFQVYDEYSCEYVYRTKQVCN